MEGKQTQNTIAHDDISLTGPTDQWRLKSTTNVSSFLDFNETFKDMYIPNLYTCG